MAKVSTKKNTYNDGMDNKKTTEQKTLKIDNFNK